MGLQSSAEDVGQSKVFWQNEISSSRINCDSHTCATTYTRPALLLKMPNFDGHVCCTYVHTVTPALLLAMHSNCASSHMLMLAPAALHSNRNH